MEQSSVGSFFKYLSGFLVFITVSFGVTFAVNNIASAKDANQEAAAAKALMLEYKK